MFPGNTNKIKKKSIGLLSFFILFNFYIYNFIFYRIFSSKFTDFFAFSISSVIIFNLSKIFFYTYKVLQKSFPHLFHHNNFYILKLRIYSYFLLYFRHTMSYKLIAGKGITSLLCLFLFNIPLVVVLSLLNF